MYNIWLPVLPFSNLTDSVVSFSNISEVSRKDFVMPISVRVCLCSLKVVQELRHGTCYFTSNEEYV